MHAKRSYSGVLAAAAATAALSLEAVVPVAAADPEQTVDAAIAAQVTAALAGDPNLEATHIEVWVRGGVVELGGFVESEQDQRLAELDASAVPGVTSITNQIELKRAATRR